MSNFAYKLGIEATDTVTGFTGMIIGRSDWTTGCRTYCLAPKLADDRSFRESQWFDEERITVKGKKVKRKGGPISRSMPKK